MSTRKQVAGAVVAVAIVSLLGYAWTERSRPAPSAAPAAEPEVLYWYDPMRPDVHFDAPGRSPFMDMDLVPRLADTPEATSAVTIDPRMAQNLGVRTSTVRRGTFWRRVDTTGRVGVDERSLTKVTVRAEGWIEVLRVQTDGEFVARGAVVAEIYSPAIATAERELALAARSTSPELVEAARAQLVGLGVDAARIDALAAGAAPSDRFILRAPSSGYVMQLEARQGDTVTPDVPLFELSNHDPIWVFADVPERQSAWIDTGKSAEIRSPALPGQTFEGTVDYVYPDMDPVTRTRRMRIVLPNPRGTLHPGMYADVVLFGGARRDVLLVPSEAVIRTGRRTVVILAEGEGRYRPLEVRLGDEREGDTVVLDGLSEGQAVVTSGQFLIDSEASLTGAFDRMIGTDAPVHGAHDHGPRP